MGPLQLTGGQMTWGGPGSGPGVAFLVFLSQMVVGQVSVNLGGGNAGVAQKLLDVAK